MHFRAWGKQQIGPVPEARDHTLMLDSFAKGLWQPAGVTLFGLVACGMMRIDFK